jgi:hypothetical protein
LDHGIEPEKSHDLALAIAKELHRAETKAFVNSRHTAEVNKFWYDTYEVIINSLTILKRTK